MGIVHPNQFQQRETGHKHKFKEPMGRVWRCSAKDRRGQSAMPPRGRRGAVELPPPGEVRLPAAAEGPPPAAGPPPQLLGPCRGFSGPCRVFSGQPPNGCCQPCSRPLCMRSLVLLPHFRYLQCDPLGPCQGPCCGRCCAWKLPPTQPSPPTHCQCQLPAAAGARPFRSRATPTTILCRSPVSWPRRLRLASLVDVWAGGALEAGRRCNLRDIIPEALLEMIPAD